MKFFRRLESEANPMLAAYTAATGRSVQSAIEDPGAVPSDWILIDTSRWQYMFDALAAADKNGTTGPPNPAQP